MGLNELISKLRDISNMRSASHFKRTICKMAAQKLEAQQARIAELEAELKDERYRHDRVQDFEVAESLELAKLREEDVGFLLEKMAKIGFTIVDGIAMMYTDEDGRPVRPGKETV